MVGAEKAARLLTELLGSVSDLRRYRDSVTREELRRSRDAQHMVLHALYVATQSALDLAMHLGADAGLPQAETYQEAFHRLGEAGWLEPPLVERLAAWAGFRNVLAHLYATIDYDRAYDTLSELSDLERFAAIVSSRLAGH
jgi:uncharacterized protein YutE (UPF0331/DUF86 family)